MSLNWKEIERSVEGLKAALEGGSIQKIWAPMDSSLEDCIFMSGHTYRKGSWSVAVALQANQVGIIHLTKENKIKASQTPSAFVMFLRKHLMNKRIRGVHQIANERVVYFTFADGSVLLAELMPRKSNLLFLQLTKAEALATGSIISAYRKGKELEGSSYELPSGKGFEVKVVRDFSEFSGDNYWERSSKALWEGLRSGVVEGERKAYLSVLNATIKKTQKSLQKFQGELKRASEKDEIKEQADVLSANLYALGAQVVPDRTEIVLDHFDGDRKIEIKLDRKYSFARNSKNLYDKYKKLIRTEREATERFNSTQEYLEKLISFRSQIEACENIDSLKELDPIFSKLQIKFKSGQSSKKKKRAVNVAKEFLELESSDGFKMLVGRSKEENRKVTFKASTGSDTWLHAKGVPGAHCIIKGIKEKSIPLSTLLEASHLVAYYSKLKQGARVEIDYTLKKHVRSQKGTVAEVTYNDYKTLYIELDTKVVRDLLQKNNV